jgi:hypothetical protein
VERGDKFVQYMNILKQNMKIAVEKEIFKILGKLYLIFIGTVVTV